ncbi:MAG TPA: hypothetical protein DDY57_07090 [Franconibacter pulveris]|nr:hypothetical protein [Franconibacter pulveris]
MNKLASLILTTTLTLASGAALAASGGAGGAGGSSAGGSNGQSNQAADAGQVAPGAKENLAPNGVNNNNINTGSGTTGTTGSGTGTNSSSNTNSGSTGTLSGDGMTTDEVHKNTMCKDGRCPDVNKKVETGSGNNNDVNTKTDGTTH